MLTLEQAEPTFESNANSTGLHKFEMVKRGTTTDGKNVYIYRRVLKTGKIFGFEVFVAKFIKAGTVLKFPGGVEKTITEDTEQYATKTDFGKRAWFCSSLERAETRFKQLIEIQHNTTENEEESEVETDGTSGVRGRPKADRPVLTLPVAEFSIKELAEQNKVDYSVAFIFAKEMETAGKIKRTREERRAARGKATQLFSKV